MSLKTHTGLTANEFKDTYRVLNKVYNYILTNYKKKINQPYLSDWIKTKRHIPSKQAFRDLFSNKIQMI